MNHLPPKPKFSYMLIEQRSGSYTELIRSFGLKEREFYQWWDKEIVPLFANAVEVYGSDERPIDGWNEKQYESTTHKALLINIQPIKEETAEDLLRDLVEIIESDDCGTYCDHSKQTLDKARAFLAKRGDKDA